MKLFAQRQVRSTLILLAALSSTLSHSLNSAVLGQVPPRAQVPLAVSGQPFGVLSVEVPLPPDWDGREPRVLVAADAGRLFYPVVSTVSVEVNLTNNGQTDVPRIGRPGGLIDRVRGALRPAAEKRQFPTAVHVTALFRGDEPLAVQLSGDINQQITFMVDQGKDVPHRKLLELWWEAYVRQAALSVGNDDAPKLVQYYLTNMLSQRLQLPGVDLDPPPADEKSTDQDQPLETLALLAAIEPMREKILERVLREPLVSQSENPVPPEPQWETSVLPPTDPTVVIEPIATRIPPECFYLRFGSFNNYVWFQELAERFGGDVTQSVFLRGFNYEASDRLERMLATKLTTVAKMFGDKLIQDMALFGSDLYMKEGASIGVIFQASNPALLKSAMESERRAVVAQNPDARMQDLVIGGATVSVLSTPDNRIRSFLLVDDKYFLNTTSQHLVERFLQVGQGEPSLASTNAFRWARGWMPEQNNYSVFGYFSPDFFHRLVSPQYQIELRRRLEAVAHLEIAEIASLAAKSEQSGQSDSLEQLKLAQLLPPWFDQRPDGSKVLRSGEHWVDAIRGARGSFLPIADMRIVGVSANEAAEYARMAEYYQKQWRRMDPLLLGIRRFQGPQGVGETVAFEAHIAPFEPKKYGWIAQQLAEPSPIEIKFPSDDAASVQLHVRSNISGESYYLFGGVKDMMPPEPEDVQGLLKTLRALKAAPAYIGAWPKPGLIEQLPLGLGAALGRPDVAGFSRMIGGLWRWQDEQWSLLSFDRQILDHAIPQLATVQSTHQAQARASIANLQDSQLARWVNTIWWQRGWRASQGNAELLDTMHQQLKIPTDQCLSVAGQLLDAKLQCPLGGSFAVQKIGSAKNESGWWQSSAWQAGTVNQRGKPLPPADYNAPWIEWFRGGKIQATQQPSSLSVVGVIQLELPPVQVTSPEPEGQTILPKLDFDMFTLPLKMFGKNADKSDPTATGTGKKTPDSESSGRKKF